jgi:hypothetical protein
MTSMVAERGPARCNTLPKTSLHSMIRISLQLISLFACISSSLLFALPITAFAGHGNTRQVTLTEAVWVGTRFLSAGDHEVKWDGPGLVQFSFLRGNKMIVTAPAIAAVAAGPHDPSRSHNSCDRRKLQST